MEYKSVNFSLEPETLEFIEILYALLDTNHFDGSMEDGSGIIGFIPIEIFDSAALVDIQSAMLNMGCKILYTVDNIPEQNWNLLWERNFEPVTINGICAIRAPFHEEFPGYKYQITIEPKMSFGTGHHLTTRLMIEELLECKLSGKNILDMGCGTGILSVLASLCGANFVTAIDIDHWAFENSIENATKNNIQNIQILCGGKEIIPNQKFDVILANINRNILLDQLEDYEKAAITGSILMISGFVKEDILILKETALRLGFEHLISRSIHEWCFMKFRKN